MWDVEAHYGPSGHSSLCCMCPSWGAWAAGRELFPLNNKCALPRVTLMSFDPKLYAEWTLTRTPIVAAYWPHVEAVWVWMEDLSIPEFSSSSYDLPKKIIPQTERIQKYFLSPLSLSTSLLPLLLVCGLNRSFYHKTSSLAPETFLTTFILPHFSCINSIGESK